MSRTTLQNTLAELYGLLADTNGNPVSSLASAGCKKVYPHEPGATGVAKPCSVTMHPSRIEPREWVITLRVYVADLTPAEAQDLLVDVPVTVGTLLKAGQSYGPDRWELGWDPDIGCWAAVGEVMVGREDNF